MPPVRLVASDLDGTLLAADGALTERTARTWKQLWDRDIDTVLVTARPPRWVDAFAAITGEHGVVICLNGAFVYDAAHREVRSENVFDPADLSAIVEGLREIPGISLAAEHADGVHRESRYPVGSPLGVSEIGEQTVAPLEDLVSPVGKLLARSDRVGETDFLAEVERIIGADALLSVSCADGLAEIGPAGVTKAGALKAWCGDLDVDAASVWAFGDMPNDIPMLQWAGTGWAVGNAHEDVLAIADRVCRPNTEDGVAQALEELVG